MKNERNKKARRDDILYGIAFIPWCFGGYVLYKISGIAMSFKEPFAAICGTVIFLFAMYYFILLHNIKDWIEEKFSHVLFRNINENRENAETK